jgi:hypothetical protein
MIWTAFTSLVALWALGVIGNVTFGGYIHVLLLAALAVVLVRRIAAERSRTA